MQVLKQIQYILIFLSLLSGCTNKSASIAMTPKIGDLNSSAVSIDDTEIPTVEFTYPTNAASISGTIIISVNAVDNTSVSKVEYFLDASSTPFGTSYTAPFDLTMDTSAYSTAAHSLKALAYDLAGNKSILQSITVTIANVADSQAPSVTLTSPANGQSISGLVALTANAFDNVAIQKVEFILDGTTILNSDTTSPYAFNWTPIFSQNGSHTLKAKAYDNSNLNTSSTQITINISIPDTTAPTVSITAPSSGTSISAATTITANAADNVAINRVEFYLDSTTLLCSDTISPYSCAWTPASSQNGAHTLLAKAFDTSNNMTNSSTVSITINMAIPDTTPPSISLTTPVNGATITGAITVAATASDNVGVSKVEFYLDNTLLGQDTTNPYSYAWTPTEALNGTHSIKAKAYDTNATPLTTTVTNAITINVDNTLPTISLTSPTNNTHVNSSVTLAASASDNVGVTKVEFYAGSTLINTILSPNVFTFAWTPTATYNGTTQALTAKAYDAAGNVKVSAIVNAIIDLTAPTVSITSPTNGATITSATTITASASDNVSVSKVEFYDGSTLLSPVDTTAPYSVSYNPTSNGTKTLKAKAYDAAGNNTTSTAITITASITPIAPSNLAVTTSSISVNSMKLTWTDNSNNESDFQLQHSTVANFATIVGTTTLAANSTSATISSLNPGTTYYFRIKSTISGVGSNWSIPAIATTLPGVQALPVNSSGDAQHTCVIKNYQLKCWGLNQYGQLGLNNTVSQTTPQLVTLNGKPVSVTLGGAHTCAIVDLTGVKSVYCWGYNFYGQLGIGSTTQVLTPTLVTLAGTNPIPKVIAAGSNHTCVIATVSDVDRLQCWGFNQYGQIGDNTTTNKLVPTFINLTGTPKTMGGGSAHTCAIVTVSGVDKVFCWGINHSGRLGIGLDDGLYYLVPKEIAAPGGAVKKLSVGRDHSCIIVAVGGVDTLKCFGLNSNGQLGVGNTAYQISAQTVTLSGTPQNIFLGYYFSCAISTVSGVNNYFCWGQNNYAQLSLPTSTTMLTSPPTTSVALSSAPTFAFTARYHTCVFSPANPNAIQCWGDNTFGQLGTGTTSTTGIKTPTTITP